MATPTLVTTGNITVIDDGESTANWVGDTFSLDPDIKVEGSNSVSCALTNNGVNEIYVSGTFNLSGGEHLRLWCNFSFVGNIASEAANGIQLWISDGTNTAFWTVGGSDTYAGGWKQFIVYTGNTPTSGTVPTGNSTQIGIRVNTTSKPRNVPANTWVDQWTFGDGYTVTGGTSVDPITWSGIASVDATSAYGIVTDVDGVIFLTGRVQIGTGATATYLESNGDILVFRDRPVSTALYELNYQGTACDVDVTGGAISAAGTQNFNIDTTTGTQSFSFDGLQISKCINPDFASGNTIINSVFDSCGQIEPSTATFTTNTIKNSTATGAGTGALRLPLTNNINNITFADNDRDLLITDAGTYSNETFTHGTNNFDIDYNNASNSTFNTPSDGNTSSVTNTGAGTMTVVTGQVTTTVTAKDAFTSALIQDARVYLTADSGGAIAAGTVIINGLTDANGEISDTRSLTQNQPVSGYVRKSSPGGDLYQSTPLSGTISTANGLTLTALMISDE